MILKRLLPSVIGVAILSACASSDPGAGAKPIASVAAALTQADAATAAGQHDKAFAILKTASGAFPADKAPWLRMAQMRFDSNNYGEAIVNGLEALQRDPDDAVAHGIVAMSGLRVSSKELADLARKNNLLGNVRSEAQDMARLLRANLGDEPPIPAKAASRAAAPKPKDKPMAASAPKSKSAADDPFGGLK
jgi:cytochrome c-type biogenesis protein CcmH/NrfG